MAGNNELIRDLTPEQQRKLIELSERIKAGSDGAHDYLPPSISESEKAARRLNIRIAQLVWGFFQRLIQTNGWSQDPTKDGNLLIDQFQGSSQPAIRFQETLRVGRALGEQDASKNADTILEVQIHPLPEHRFYKEPPPAQYQKDLELIIRALLIHTEFISNHESYDDLKSRIRVQDPQKPIDSRWTWITHPDDKLIIGIEEGMHRSLERPYRCIDKFMIFKNEWGNSDQVPIDNGIKI